MLIPYQEIPKETLTSLVESFVLREGTDYGDAEVSLTRKVSQVIEQIKQGKVVIVYSELHESCDLVPASKYQQGLKD
jgi:uncharacterized protein